MKIDKFKVYHEENPDIYNQFERFTFDVIKSGRKYFGAQSILERLRWFHTVEAKNDTFKINNDCAAFYSRMFEQRHPSYNGFFKKRRSVADKIIN